MKLTELFNNKLNDIKLQHAKGTYTFYKSHIGHFLNWCEQFQITSSEDVTTDVIVDYIQDMKQTCTNATINKRIGIIKRAFKHNQIDFEYLYQIPKLKEQRKTFNMLSKEELKKVIDYTMALPDIYNNKVYKLLILLLIDTGARINEVLSIEKKYIDLETKEITLVTTKTKTDRVVYFMNDTKKHIEKLINHDKGKYLLYNFDKDRPLIYDDVRFFLRLLKSKLKIKILHAHMFRHTFATLWIENDADIISVQRVLGHSNIKTTERYLHTSNKHVKKQYDERFKRY